MSGFNLKRKMKRTKQQELRVVESMNSQSIQRLAVQQYQIAAAQKELEKNFLALINILKRRGLVDDLMIHQALGEIAEYERLQKLAINIDPNKKEVKVGP